MSYSIHVKSAIDGQTMTGLILLNLGTPEAPTAPAVKRYLLEFLMDPYVIDIPWVWRWLLVHFIVPRRSHSSAELYRKIWTQEGSPLLVHTLGLAEKVQKQLGAEWKVVPAMRYGEPSLGGAVDRLRDSGVDRIVLFPLYPQYSLAATESSVRHFETEMRKQLPDMKWTWVPPFYDHPAYLDAAAAISKKHLPKADRVLFSFHGLPERQVKKSAPEAHCLEDASCCAAVTARNAQCYRAQCYATARSLAERLGLTEGKWEVGFQSRLGGTPWIQPYSDVLYETLPKQGVKTLAVLTPSFIADCLETLEEVAMRGKESFEKAGGQELTLVPSLNEDPLWVEAVSKIASGYYGF